MAKGDAGLAIQAIRELLQILAIEDWHYPPQRPAAFFLERKIAKATMRPTRDPRSLTGSSIAGAGSISAAVSHASMDGGPRPRGIDQTDGSSPGQGRHVLGEIPSTRGGVVLLGLLPAGCGGEVTRRAEPRVGRDFRRCSDSGVRGRANRFRGSTRPRSITVRRPGRALARPRRRSHRETL